jgi:Ca2+-binding EF-hand superfamily protein
MSGRLGKGGAAAVLVLALLAVVPAGTTADGPARNADPGGADDVQDLLYFTEARPFVFRLHLTIDGQPHGVVWTKQILKVFNYLDRDGDGILSKEEVAFAPAPQQMAQLFHGAPYATVAFNGDSIFAEMDADCDKKVTPAEFLNYYRRSAAGPVQLVAGPVGGNNLTETLFKVLNTNNDGKLSQKELAAAEFVLHKYDQNDDEVVTAQELTQAVVLPASYPGMMQAPAPRPLPVVDSPFMLVPREEAPKRVIERLKAAKQVLARYDKDKNGKLSPAEIGLPKDVFDRYDADRDGEWSAVELLRWMIFEPDVETTVRLGRMSDKDAPLDLVSLRAASDKLRFAANKTASNTVTVSMNDAQISLIHSGGVGGYGYSTDSVFQAYQQQFQMIDKDGKGFITREQAGAGQNATLYGLFPIADRDGDGRLTEEELKAWAALATEAVGRAPTISVTDNGRSLFNMIDVNNDGRLTVRELRGAWARLAPYDLTGRGAVSREEIPHQFQLSIGEAGFDANTVPQAQVQQAMMAPRTMPSRIERGPLWFRRMDVNGDGDVSPREFLGSLEDFRRIDANGDGLISLEEAEAFDARMRVSKDGN